MLQWRANKCFKLTLQSHQANEVDNIRQGRRCLCYSGVLINALN